MGVLREGKVAVNLIGNHIDIVPAANVSDAPQFLRRPDTAYRIMRAAQEEQPDVLLHDFAFKIRKINGVPAILIDQRAFHNFSVIIPNHAEERVIDRRLNQDTVAGFRQRSDRHGQGIDHTGRFDQPLRFGFPPEVRSEPAGHRFKVGSFRIAVTKDTDVYTIWADSLIYDRCFMNGSFRRYITHVGRKDGRPYLRTAAEVDGALGEAILEEFDVSLALAAEMGNHAWLLKADTDEQRRQQIRLILEEENAHET